MTPLNFIVVDIITEDTDEGKRNRIDPSSSANPLALDNLAQCLQNVIEYKIESVPRFSLPVKTSYFP